MLNQKGLYKRNYRENIGKTFEEVTMRISQGEHFAKGELADT
jgi:hypothetical protein